MDCPFNAQKMKSGLYVLLLEVLGCARDLVFRVGEIAFGVSQESCSRQRRLRAGQGERDVSSDTIRRLRRIPVDSSQLQFLWVRWWVKPF